MIELPDQAPQRVVGRQRRPRAVHQPVGHDPMHRRQVVLQRDGCAQRAAEARLRDLPHLVTGQHQPPVGAGPDSDHNSDQSPLLTRREVDGVAVLLPRIPCSVLRHVLQVALHGRSIGHRVAHRLGGRHALQVPSADAAEAERGQGGVRGHAGPPVVLGRQHLAECNVHRHHSLLKVVEVDQVIRLFREIELGFGRERTPHEPLNEDAEFMIDEVLLLVLGDHAEALEGSVPHDVLANRHVDGGLHKRGRIRARDAW
mmetsp:Transcript_11483/g.40880  ORF Transcript_11483/g.40880 Transcript_11483/m.40880 type:complete len:257 (+) Transcript_11483:908-1678(+)